MFEKYFKYNVKTRIKYNINTNKIKNIDNEHPVLCNK